MGSETAVGGVGCGGDAQKGGRPALGTAIRCAASRKANHLLYCEQPEETRGRESELSGDRARKRAFRLPEFADLAKYKVFDNIIAITNDAPEEVPSSADFSKASIDRRIAAGYHDAMIALTEPPKRAADIAKAITLRSKLEKAEEHAQELLEPSGATELPPAGQPQLATPRPPTPASQQVEEIADVMRKMLANEPGGRSS